MQSDSAEISLEQTVRLEGWSLHQRLSWIADQEQLPGYASLRNESLQTWRQVVAPDNPDNFDKRLAWDGLTLSKAAWALAPAAADCPQEPTWWPLLESLRQAARNTQGISGISERGHMQPFVHVWRPAASWALQTLQLRCAYLSSSLQLGHDAWLDLGEALLERLCNTADQALLELFNQRRTPGQMLLAHLGDNLNGNGEPVHEAYDNFVTELLSSGYGLLLGEFPVLGRLLAVVTELWLESSAEMLQRLATSRLALQQHFEIAPDDLLHKVKLGLSDPHRGGRAVAILSFGQMGGDDVTNVVYKPKDMKVDQTYQDFMETLNDASTLLELRRLTVLSCDGYGFMEWVDHCTCRSDDELARFYTNAGRTMAVLYLLGCTDCHYENLIASVDQLMLIDTETLLEAELTGQNRANGDSSDLFSDLQISMQGSVLRSGLLPQWLMAGAGKKQAFDISALGIQPPPFEVELPSWLGLNSDGMMLGRSMQACELPTSLPVGLGTPQRLTDFIEQLCDGFALQLKELMRLRSPLLRSLSRFSHQPRRLVARATRIYFSIQRQMLEPAALRSAVAHGLKLEQLSRGFLLASEKPLNWAMFQSELLQMERLDIPFFEHLIDSVDLPLPDGLAPIPGLIEVSGLSAANQRLHELSEIEIGFQQQLIRGAITARNLKSNPQGSAAKAVDESAALQFSSAIEIASLDANVYRQEAFQLGEELWNAAIRDRKGRPEWLGIDLGADGESFNFGLIGNSLYSGNSGIALLFARLAVASPNLADASQWRERAWSCVATLAECKTDELFRLMRNLPYGMAGSGGIILALQLMAEANIKAVEPLVSLLVEQLQNERLFADENVDVISGITGLIGPLLRLESVCGQALAISCGERLVHLQLANGGWPSLTGQGFLNHGRPPLTGFSHGAAGMAAALARLAQATGYQHFASAAQRAVDYERSVFVNEQGNWPDFRGTSKSNEFMLSWCHGAPGILLSRQVLQVAGIGDNQTISELQTARASTISALERFRSTGGDTPAHLCCGVLGLTSLLRIDAQASGAEVDTAASEVEASVISRALAGHGYTFFNVDAGSLNLPGLLTGKAGVALALLEASGSQSCLPQVLSAGLLDNSPKRPS